MTYTTKQQDHIVPLKGNYCWTHEMWRKWKVYFINGLTSIRTVNAYFPLLPQPFIYI